jgi:hypothetical protein
MSSEIDPWALPGQPAAAGYAGVPGGAPVYRPVQPLNRTLPLVVLGLGVLYILVSLAEVLCNSHEISLLDRMQDQLAAGGSVTDDQFAQLKSADNLIVTVSWIALVVFIAALVAIRSWQSSLSVSLGSVGARRAVFARAGYVYFRAAWIVSILLSVFLQATTNRGEIDSVQDAISHDHAYMIYFGLRAVVGLVLLFFAYRLKTISEEGVARLAGASAQPAGWSA